MKHFRCFGAQAQRLQVEILAEEDGEYSELAKAVQEGVGAKHERLVEGR